MMLRLVVVGMLFVLSGCGRQMNYYYYPGKSDDERVARHAQRECAKYGKTAAATWTLWPDFEREQRAYKCE
jgi:predicted small lipoprotein YifL